MNLVLPCQTFLLALLVSLEPSQLGLCTFSGRDLHYCKPSKITDEFVFCWQLVHFTPVSSLIGLFLAGMANDHLQKFLIWSAYVRPYGLPPDGKMSTEFDAAAADCSDNANIHIPPPLITTCI